MIPRLALTLGEPAGIGPDICLQIAQFPLPFEVVVVGSPDLLRERAKLLNLPIDLYAFDAQAKVRANGNGQLAIFPVVLNAPCTAQILNVANAEYVLQTLNLAYQLCSQKYCHALVTGPIHKALINQSGIAFSGHTEYLAQLAQVDVLMTFYTPEVIVGLVTTHCPLKMVSEQLTSERLLRAIELFEGGLSKLFHHHAPTIGICGLNPHAGEDGHLGKEEQLMITPLINELVEQGMSLYGPLPGDTAFTPENRKAFDGILAMYHDQGLAPIKALFFNEIVNMTLGLPFLRTSVDHGTALSLAGTGLANPSSLMKALEIAAKYYHV